jgi:hypothetical protein
MQIQKHINATDVEWYRCKRVSFDGETATWELGQSSKYNMLEAYQMKPHMQLINAATDEALRAFIKAWGPLRVSLDTWSGCDPIEKYRRKRDELTASVRLLASIEEPGMQRQTLQELVQLGNTDDDAFHIFLATLRAKFRIEGEMQSGFDVNLQSWVETASAKDIEVACITLVSLLPLEKFTHELKVDTAGKSNVVRASIGVTTLEEALHWMTWQDVFHRHPFQFCVECRALFQPDWKHARKFCKPECAHRKSGREWQKRKRANERTTDGTQKAR